MKRIIRSLVLILLLAVVVAGGFWYYRNRSASSTAAAASTNLTQVVDVTRGNLSATISVVGELNCGRQCGPGLRANERRLQAREPGG